MSAPALAKLLAKARKLRALQRRATTAGEAQAAAAALAKLLDKHRLDAADLDQPEEFATADEPLLVGKRVARWVTGLAVVLANHFGVFIFRRRDVGAAAGYMLHGTADDIACVRYMFAWLQADIVRLGREVRAADGAHAAASWRLGFVAGLQDQFALARTDAASEAPPASRALVIVNGRLARAQAHHQANHGRLRSARRRKLGEVDPQHYRSGWQRGYAHHLGKNLETSSS